MSVPEIGILQGRLTPSRGRGIQFFPDAPGEWEKEFEVAKTAGVQCIQWVWDKEDNLLSDALVRASVRVIAERAGIRVRNMDVQLFTKLDIRDSSNELLERICGGLADIAGGAIELPLMEASGLLESDAFPARIASLERCMAIAERHGVPVAIETDLAPKELAALVDAHPALSIVYDTGNSAGMGYDMREELAAYGRRISNVHIKDKPRGGATVPLGTGSVDFAALFQLLRSMSYTGYVTLQAAREADGGEIETVTRQVAFVRNYAGSL